MNAHLALVNGAETRAERIARLQAEARAEARAHLNDVIDLLKSCDDELGQIVTGGEAYPAGIRDLARKLADHIANNADNIQSLMMKAN